MANKFVQRAAKLFGYNPATAPAPALNKKQAVALRDHAAVDAILNTLTSVVEVDETLRKAGIRRHNLKRLMTDDDIFQAANTRMLAVLGTPLRMEPDDGPAAELLKVNFKGQMLTDMMGAAWQAVLYGYSVQEAVYADLGGQTHLKWVGAKPMQWFEPQPDGTLLYKPSAGFNLNSSQALTAKRADGSYVVDQHYKFFLTQHQASYEQPRGEAYLSRLYLVWFLATQGWQFWAQFLERFGRPLLVGKSSTPADMIAALVEAQRNAALAIGIDDEATVLGAPSGASTSFSDFQEALSRRVAKLLLGQTLTSGTDGGSGNRALGQVHNMVREDIASADKLLVTATLQKIANALLLLNGYPADSVVLTLSDNKGLEKERAERDEVLHKIGVRFSESYVTDNYDLREQDFVISTDASKGAPGKNDNPVAAATDDGGTSPPASQQDGGAGLGDGGSFARSFLRRTPGSRFTKQQQQVEQVGDALLHTKLQPLSTEQLRQVVFAATDPQDLERRLYALCGPRQDFTELLERTLMVADVLGYVHEEGKL